MNITRISAVSLILGILLASLAILPAFAADTGTVTFSVSQLGVADAATITVDDADLNVLVPATNVRSGTWGSVGSTVFLSLGDTQGQTGASFGTGAAAGDEIAGTPTLAGSTTAGKATSDYSVSVFNRTTGRILAQFGGASAPGSDTLTFTYNLATRDSANVQVTAPSDPAGVTVVLTETGADTGVFEGRVALSSTASIDVAGSVPATTATSSLDRILAVLAQTVTVTYTDADPAGTRTDTLVVGPSSVAGAASSSSSTVGTVALSAAQLAPTDAVTITVTDADLSTLSVKSATVTGTWNAVGSTAFLNLPDSQGQTGSSFGTGAAADDAISGVPSVTSTTGGAISDYSLSVFNSTTGRILVQFGGAVAPGAATLTVGYNLTGVSTTTVDVTSPSDATGVSVVLAETAQGTGIFTGRVAIGATGSVDVAGAVSLSAPTSSLDRIHASTSQVVTVTYTDADPSGTAQQTVAINSPTSSLGTAGTIAVDRAYLAPLGSATITVDDDDLNVLVPATNVRSASWGSVGSTIFLSLDDTNGQSGSNFASGTSVGDEILGTPTIIGLTSAGKSAADYSVSVFNRTTGRILVQFGGAAAPGNDTLTIGYNLATRSITTANVSGPSDPSGITVTLAETGADTGIFKGSFSVTGLGGTTSYDSANILLAVPGQEVTVKYTDASPSAVRQTTLLVENTKPTGTLVAPADGSSTTSLAPKLTVDFVDTDSGVNSGSIEFIVVYAKAAGDATTTIDVGTPTITAIANGFRAEVTLDASQAADKTVNIRWRAIAQDSSGNQGRTDADSGATGDQDYAFVIDKQAPDFVSSVVHAGPWWDSANSKVETDSTKSSATTISVQFPKALDISGSAFDVNENIDGTSVSVADFEIDNLKLLAGTTVNDITPSAAVVFSGAPDRIFLTVPTMAPDAKPTVILLNSAGGISDAVGNVVSSGSLAAGDRQAATVTASLDRSLHNQSATLTITANEPGGVPVVTVSSASEINNGNPVAQTVTLVGTNQYESTIQPGVGVHSIRVRYSDTSSNQTYVGGNEIASDWPTSGAIPLYIDNNLPAPTISPVNGATIANNSPITFTLDFSAEGIEYGLSAGATVTNDASKVVTDLDIHNTVTVATVTLDGADVSASLSTSDNITYTLALPVVSAGAHTLRVIATDLAGNQHDTGNLSYTLVGASPTNTDLSITKTASPSPVNAAQSMTYQLAAANNGPADASNVVVTDTLPSQVTFVSATPAQGSCSESSGTVTCNLGTVTDGASVAISIVVTAPSSGQTITNTASITATEPDGVPSNNSTSLDTTVVANADLAVTKTSSPPSVSLNEQITYSVVTTNNGPSSATNVVLSDNLPSSASFVSATVTQGSCSESGGIVTCNIGTLANGAAATATIRVNAPGTSQSLTNTASASATETDPTSGNNSATAITAVAQSADLAITKSSEVVVVTGLPFTYTVTITNNGPAAANSITVTDTLPSGTTFVSASAGCSANGLSVTCSIASLNNGDSTVLSIVATAPLAPGDIVNTASVSAASPPDSDSANNSVSTITQVATVVGVPAIGIWGMGGLLVVFAIVVFRARRGRNNTSQA